MTNYTLYIDESGQFVRSKVEGYGLNLRLVGGCVLRGTPDEHSSAVEGEIAAALDWWRGERHALNLRSPVKVAFEVRAAARGRRHLPNRIEEYARELEALPGAKIAAFATKSPCKALLRDEGNRLLTRALCVLGAQNATVVLAVEDDHRPATSRYPDMGVAAVTRAMVEVAMLGADTRLGVVIARGGAGGTAWIEQLPGIASRISRRFGRDIGLGSVEIADALARHRPALFLADAVTHAFGPQGTQNVDIEPRQRDDWNHSRVTGRIISRCGAVSIAMSSGFLQPIVDTWVDGDAAKARSMLAQSRGRGHLSAVIDDLDRVLLVESGSLR